MIRIVLVTIYILFKNSLSPAVVQAKVDVDPSVKSSSGAANEFPSTMQTDHSLDSKEKKTEDKKLTVKTSPENTIFPLYVANSLYSYVSDRDYIVVLEFTEFVQKIEHDFNPELIKLEESVYISLINGIRSSLSRYRYRFRELDSLEMVFSQLKYDLQNSLLRLSTAIFTKTMFRVERLDYYESISLLKDRNYLWLLVIYYGTNIPDNSKVWNFMEEIDRRHCITHDINEMYRINDPDKILHELDGFQLLKSLKYHPEHPEYLDIVTMEETRHNRVETLHKFMIHVKNTLYKLLELLKYDFHAVQCTIAMGSIDEPSLGDIRKLLVNRVRRLHNVYPNTNPIYCLPGNSVESLDGVLDRKMIDSINNYLLNWRSY